jgi:hypothetical protein
MERKEEMRDKRRCLYFVRSDVCNSILQSGDQMDKLHLEGASARVTQGSLKADSHIAYRAHAVPLRV